MRSVAGGTDEVAGGLVELRPELDDPAGMARSLGIDRNRPAAVEPEVPLDAEAGRVLERLERSEPDRAQFRGAEAEIGQAAQNVVVFGIGSDDEPGARAARVEEFRGRREVRNSPARGVLPLASSC